MKQELISYRTEMQGKDRVLVTMGRTCWDLEETPLLPPLSDRQLDACQRHVTLLHRAHHDPRP